MRSTGVLLLCCLALAACGGGSSRLSGDEYKAKLAELGKQEDAAQAAVRKAQSATTVKALSALLGAFEKAEQHVGDEVAKLDPPRNAVAANEELAAGLHGIAKAIEGLLPRVEAMPSAKAALFMLSRSEDAAVAGQQVNHALNALKKLGYAKGS